MNKEKLTNIQLLQELEQKLKTKEIFFWIDNQDCYLLQWTIHYSNKIKVGDLSQTKENYFKELEREFWKLTKEKEARAKFLTSKFLEISDVELIEELKNRVEYKPTIKLSMYPDHQHIFIEAKDIKCGTITPLSIEIKEKDQDL